MSKYRKGTTRKHEEGYAIHVWLGDEVKYATVYGATEQEARLRASNLTKLLNAGHGAKYEYGI